METAPDDYGINHDPLTTMESGRFRSVMHSYFVHRIKELMANPNGEPRPYDPLIIEVLQKAGVFVDLKNQDENPEILTITWENIEANLFNQYDVMDLEELINFIPDALRTVLFSDLK